MYATSSISLYVTAGYLTEIAAECELNHSVGVPLLILLAHLRTYYVDEIFRLMLALT